MIPEDPSAYIPNLADISHEDKAKLDALNLVPCPIILTTGNHGIVWHNQAFYNTYSDRIPNMDEASVSAMLGCSLSCQNKPGAYEEICQDCPLFKTYQALEHNEESVQSGSILIPVPWGNYELNVEVSARFITISGQKLYMLTVRDTARAMNRYEINRSLFHDLLNIGQQMRSSTNLAKMTIEDAQREGYRIPTQLNRELQLIGESLTTLTNLVNAQRQLNNAQAQTLQPNVTEFTPATILQSCVESLRNQDACAGRLPILVPGDPELTCRNDVQLLQQVVYALLYTLVYASRNEQIIELGYEAQNDILQLWMRNRELQLNSKKILQFRNTYSFKRTRSMYSHTLEILLPYIKGEISLTSHTEEGPTFTIDLPLAVQ